MLNTIHAWIFNRSGKLETNYMLEMGLFGLLESSVLTRI